MVKGLKVLRHKRAEVGYFNEFLIAKTPVDLENCPFSTVTLAAPVSAATAATNSGAMSMGFQQQLQAGLLSPSTEFILYISTAATSHQWQYDHHHHQQQQATQLNSSAGTERNSSASNVHSGVVARQEVVVTSSTAPATSAPAPTLAIGMSKMKLSLSRNDSRIPSRPSTSTPRSACFKPSSASSKSTSDDTFQRRANRRRERNRAAAARCRKKRQDQLEGLAEEVRQLETERASLETRVAALTTARSDLLRRLREHQLTCPEIAGVAMATPSLVSLATMNPARFDAPVQGAPPDGGEILLTPSFLLPPPNTSILDEDAADPFKLEPL